MECHVGALEEQCVAELHGEDWDGATLLGVHLLVGVVHLLLLTEEAQLPALGHLQLGHKECSHQLACPTSSTKFPLREHNLKLTAMRTM